MNCSCAATPYDLIFRAGIWIGTLLLLATPSIAGGPQRVSGGAPLIWSTGTVSYVASPNAIHAVSSPNILKLIQSAAATWGSVSTAGIGFKFNGVLSVSTYAAYIQKTEAEQANLVVVDPDGSLLIEPLHGVGADKTILGWTDINPGTPALTIVQFSSVLNGGLIQGEGAFSRTMVHEFGHAIGLDHAQINDGDEVTSPVMYPAVASDYKSSSSLKPDDIAWASKLYPSKTFKSTYAVIKGKLVRDGGTPVLGANIIFTDESNDTSRIMNRFSCVSDWLMNKDGAFEIAVTPGVYSIQIEPVDPAFSGPSSVGHYAESQSDRSFADRIAKRVFPTLLNVIAGSTTDLGPLSAN